VVQCLNIRALITGTKCPRIFEKLSVNLGKVKAVRKRSGVSYTVAGISL